MSHGVKVIAAHCASLGESHDEDTGVLTENFTLWLRMMDDPRWKGLLFGDISATTQVNRWQCLQTLLPRTDLHSRLVNGTDYPLPAAPLLTSVTPYERAHMISKREAAALRELYELNPLAADACLKRTIRTADGVKFPVSMFCQHPDLILFDEKQLLETFKAEQAKDVERKFIDLSEEVDQEALAHITSQIAFLEQLLEEKREQLERLLLHKRLKEEATASGEKSH